VDDAPDGWVVEQRGADVELMEVEGCRFMSGGKLSTASPFLLEAVVINRVVRGSLVADDGSGMQHRSGR
jgi:hypothetical protein